MKEKAWGNAYRVTTVCVDSYHNGILAGRFFNPYLETGERFESLTQLLIKLDQVLDAMQFPQPYAKIRTFADPLEPKELRSADTDQTGKQATFAVKVLFRQNASWQGTIVWREGGREQSFRSALELVFLMDSVLNQAS